MLTSPRSAAFLKLIADEVLVFARLTHLNIREASFFALFLWLDAATRPFYINYISYTVNAFRVQVGNGLEDVLFLHFSLVSIQFDSCGPHWWLRSYSSQTSEGYKLKAACLFLICFFLCNFWHIFRSSDKVT